MLWHVKKLIRKRQELYKKATGRQNTRFSRESMRTSSANHKLHEIEEHDKNSSNSDGNDKEDYKKKL